MVDCIYNLKFMYIYIYLNLSIYIYMVCIPTQRAIRFDIYRSHSSGAWLHNILCVGFIKTKVLKNPRVSARTSSHMQNPMVLGKVVEANHTTRRRRGSYVHRSF